MTYVSYVNNRSTCPKESYSIILHDYISLRTIYIGCVEKQINHPKESFFIFYIII